LYGLPRCGGQPRERQAERRAQPIAVKLETAASMVAMSPDSFDRYVRPHIKVIRRGRVVVVPVAELERWCRENAENIWDGAR
jgi:hypothetical protein